LDDPFFQTKSFISLVPDIGSLILLKITENILSRNLNDIKDQVMEKEWCQLSFSLFLYTVLTDQITGLSRPHLITAADWLTQSCLIINTEDIIH
jgi:hypothetical protein